MADGVPIRLRTSMSLGPSWRLLYKPWLSLWQRRHLDLARWQEDPIIAEAIQRAHTLEERDLSALSWDEVLANFRAALFAAGPERPARLLLIAHHLVVDGVSWPVLLADLRAAAAGFPLPPKTTSFRRWAERLREYARTAELRPELTDPASPWASKCPVVSL
jgi:hypothetical protein